MGEITPMTGNTRAAPIPVEEGAIYVVQTIREDILVAARDGQTNRPPGDRAWVDVATVTVPKRTKRDTVIRKAVEQARLNNGSMVVTSATLRVIPLEHAEEIPVSWEQPPPQLVIGDRDGTDS